MNNNQIALIHKRKSYEFWQKLRKQLKDTASADEALLIIHQTIDQNLMYGSITRSIYSIESLNQLIKENGNG